MGKIEIDHTGSGGGITLSSDGTSLLLGGTAIGGSALELYAENPSSATTPVASGSNAVAIGTNAEATLSNSIAFGSSASATGGSGTAIGSSARASGTYSVALGQGADATNTFALALGNNAQAVTGNAAAIGYSYASGSYGFAVNIANNTSSYGATGANSIAMGYLAKATASDSFCIADTSTASGIGASVLGGQSSTASGSNSTTIGGGSNTASGDYSTAKGYYGNANGIRLKHATGVYPNQQGAYYVMGYTTSDATPIALNTSVWTPSSTNQIVLPNNSAYAFHGTIVARQQASGGTACAAWKIEGLIRREANAGTTTLVNSATTVLDNTPSWGMALSADTTNGCLKIEVTGAASTNIRWVATIHTSEVTYA